MDHVLASSYFVIQIAAQYKFQQNREWKLGMSQKDNNPIKYQKQAEWVFNAAKTYRIRKQENE